MQYQPLFNDSYLRSLWAAEFEAFRASERDEELRERLLHWAEREFQKETSAQQPFVDLFFKQTWGYRAAGEGAADDGYTCYSEYSVAGAGGGGSVGSADLALGWFGTDEHAPIPQVLCEFKDVRSGLDSPQSRKGNDRSPVEQCNDYLQGARRQTERLFHGNPRVRPAWGVVTDMNEFRLFHIDRGFEQSQRFVIQSASPRDVALVERSPVADFQRFVFWKIFRPEMLLSDLGPGDLERRLSGQIAHEKNLESEFYKDYQRYRQHVYESLVAANPRFSGTRGDLVRLTQNFLDRCIFALYCEDMGSALNFPPNLVRDVLGDLSQSRMMDRHDNTAWDRIRRLFDAMAHGGPYAGFSIDRFNGGLFAEDTQLDQLNIPTHVFCEPGQLARVDAHPKTLLYLSQAYNFGATGDDGESGITLYTLGRIFEQSITELEIMEAEAEGRPSLNKITKRKRNGVYYTPERIVHYIVQQTIGRKLKELRADTGVERHGPISDELVYDYQHKKDLRTSEHRRVEDYLAALNAYQNALGAITVVDPACGSGAFLIAALQYLVQSHQWIFDERNRIIGQARLFDHDATIKEVLRNNLYGVDINAESVEITKLALWLNTAVPGKPLSALDHTIRCGNSLVDSDLSQHIQLDMLEIDTRERINVFDWEEAFPEVFAQGGFDIVIGNPPYVKLQHFRKVFSHVAEYLVDARRADGASKYRSTQTGNFDLYLPFIERGMALLKEGGRLGYIAPSLWLKNQYGEGLRELVHQEQWLDRWVDFGSFQIFDEATTYTSLQFFHKHPTPGITFAAAPDGNLAKVDWETRDTIPWADLPSADTWNLHESREFQFLKRLSSDYPTLGDIKDIIVGFRGIESGADYIYYFDEKIGPNLYRRTSGSLPYDSISLEDELMVPLVSGSEADRYTRPTTTRWALFPFYKRENPDRLVTQSDMKALYPRVWKYLKSHEDLLRARDNGKANNDEWYDYIYHKNHEKQMWPKLGFPQTIDRLGGYNDSKGDYFHNNVRVGGVTIKGNTQHLWALLSLLNHPLLDWVFRRISRPKRGGYFEANKQFLLPLPIIDLDPSASTKLTHFGQTLQKLYTIRRDLMTQIDRRLESAHMQDAEKDWTWLWGARCDWKTWRDGAPKALKGAAKTRWCKEQCAELLDAKLSEVQHFLNQSGRLNIRSVDGELLVEVGGVPALDGIFAEEAAEWIAAQWRHKWRNTGKTTTPDAKRLLADFLRLKDTDNHALITRVSELDQELEQLEAKILATEAELDELVYTLYGLSEEERAMVEADKRPVF